jgi:Fe2+ or Zn2+ uptake regulation protein
MIPTSRLWPPILFAMSVLLLLVMIVLNGQQIRATRNRLDVIDKILDERTAKIDDIHKHVSDRTKGIQEILDLLREVKK